MKQKRRSSKRKTRKNIVVFDTNDSLSKDPRNLNYGLMSKLSKISFKFIFFSINLFPTTLLNAKQCNFLSFASCCSCFCRDDIFSTIASALFIAADCEYVNNRKKIFMSLKCGMQKRRRRKLIKSIQIWTRPNNMHSFWLRVFDIAYEISPQGKA
jgi:hypothetical protein